MVLWLLTVLFVSITTTREVARSVRVTSIRSQIFPTPIATCVSVSRLL